MTLVGLLESLIEHQTEFYEKGILCLKTQRQSLALMDPHVRKDFAGDDDN